MFLVKSKYDNIDSIKSKFYLGEWCLNSDKQNLKDKDIILKHHWITSKDIAKDGDLIEDIYERFLFALAKELNKYHNKDWSLRSWRILIGPWLYKIISIVFDRWKLVERALDESNIDMTYVSQFGYKDLYTDSYLDLSYECKQDFWNKVLFDQITKFKNINYKTVKIKNKNSLKGNFENKNYFIKKIIKKIIFSKIFQKILRKIKNFDSVAVVDVYISLTSQMIIKIFSKSIPIPDFTIRKIKHAQEIDNNLRNDLKLEIDCPNQIDYFINELIFKVIPSIYLENMNSLSKSCFNSSLPDKPKIILTSVGQFQNEIFKFWAAKRIHENTKLFIIQHGGMYGTALLAPDEKHCKLISDIYFVWGWAQNRNKLKNISIPIVSFSDYGSFDKNGPILIVLRELSYKPYMSFFHSHEIFSDRSNFYRMNVINLIKLLNQNICTKLIKLRFYPDDIIESHNIVKANNIKDILISSEKSMHVDLKSSSIAIFTYDGTGFLESMALGHPSVLLLLEDLNSIRPSAYDAYQKLIDAKIAHLSIESLSDHLNKIENNILLWWNSIEVIKKRDGFCNLFACQNDSIEDAFIREKNNAL